MTQIASMSLETQDPNRPKRRFRFLFRSRSLSRLYSCHCALFGYFGSERPFFVCVSDDETVYSGSDVTSVCGLARPLGVDFVSNSICNGNFGKIYLSLAKPHCLRTQALRLL